MAELASQPTSIQSIYTWYRDAKLFVNRRYQRKLVWTQHEKQKLIESILKKYPIPAILIAERDAIPGTYEIIDGLQRLHSIVSFIENGFCLEDGRFFAVDFFPTAKTASAAGAFRRAAKDAPTISSREVSIILDYSLALSVMRNATDAEVNDVFDRINTYGHRLSDQERRQAGVQNEFSQAVRTLASTLRGDSSGEIVPLEKMPAISIDLPSANHGYEVKAEEVFWVKQGILRSTDLRDSLDEQCIADVIACIVGGKLIERSKDALDAIYDHESYESKRITDALDVYGQSKVIDEIKYCISEVLKICADGEERKLRDVIFAKRTTNAFPSLFSVILIAIHQQVIKGKKISDYAGVKSALSGLSARVSTARKGATEEERTKNVSTVSGLIAPFFLKTKAIKQLIYKEHSSVDIDDMIRRSEIELPHYELKQGLLRLTIALTEDTDALEKIINTICAIANIGKDGGGKIIIGVTDKPADARRIKELDGVEARKIGRRYVVGVSREARKMGITPEQYFSKWKNALRSSQLSEKLKADVLSKIDYNNYYGLGIIVITVQKQKQISYVGEKVFLRNADATQEATTAKQVAEVVARF